MFAHADAIIKEVRKHSPYPEMDKIHWEWSSQQYKSVRNLQTLQWKP